SPGETATKTYDRFVVPREAIHFRVTIDPDNHVMESDEDHNTRQFYLDPPRLPDLVVSSVTFDAQGIPTIAITNNGQADATLGVGSNEFIYVTYQWLDANKQALGQKVPFEHLRGFQPRGKDAISPGETVTATVYRPPPPALARFLTVTVDTPDRVWESNEDNNVLTQELPASLLPDLTVEHITFDNGKPQVRIKNIGKGTVDLGTTPDTSVMLTVGWKDAQGNTIPPGPEQLEVRRFTSLRLLAPGASLLLKADISPSQGAIASWAFIDNPDRVKESNECNNELIALIVSQETSAEDMTAFDQKLLVDRIRKGNPCTKITSTGTPPGVPRKPPVIPPMKPPQLPFDIPLGFSIKDFGRSLAYTFTFDDKKKVDLLQQFTQEKILEAHTLMNANKGDLATKRLRSYGDDVHKLLVMVQTIEKKDPTTGATAAAAILEDQLVHQVLLEIVKQKIPQQKQNDFTQTRTRMLKDAGELIGTIKDNETVSRILAQSLDKSGSPLRTVQNLDVLKALEEQIPETAKSVVTRKKEEDRVYLQNATYTKDLNLAPLLEKSATLPSDEGIVDWKSFFPPEALKELEESLGPMLEQIRQLCGKLPQTEAEAQECAQKILGGESLWAVPTIDEGTNE
ncbi:hypothetical protein HYV22_00035, partial [Candidatus Gottesmanbacteria bacterium]|nr:hypothetical protein [Candidatus Gottesmanbacteria bacterium]